MVSVEVANAVDDYGKIDAKMLLRAVSLIRSVLVSIDTKDCKALVAA